MQLEKPICYLEALNAVVAIKLCASQLAHQFVHLFCDNVTAHTINQAGRGRDTFLEACAQEMWITCAIWDITLAVGHIPGESLMATTDALSKWHLGQVFTDRISALVKDRGITL